MTYFAKMNSFFYKSIVFSIQENHLLQKMTLWLCQSGNIFRMSSIFEYTAKSGEFRYSSKCD